MVIIKCNNKITHKDRPTPKKILLSLANLSECFIGQQISLHQILI